VRIVGLTCFADHLTELFHFLQGQSDIRSGLNCRGLAQATSFIATAGSFREPGIPGQMNRSLTSFVDSLMLESRPAAVMTLTPTFCTTLSESLRTSPTL
jgi:hypothetical protein